MQSLRVLMSFHTRTIRTLLFVTLFGASVSFATPPVSPYTPGTTLDPLCTPGSTNCTVQIIPAQTGNTNKLLTTSGSVTSWTDTLTGISLSGATNTLSNIPNSALTNSTISINGTPVALGGSVSNLALTTAPLSQFAATTSSQLAGVLSDESGSGSVAYTNSPTFITPTLGDATATSLILTTSPTASGGGYELITRNTTTGIIEKVASTTFPSGSGTTNYLSRFTGANTLGNSSIFDDGVNVGVGTGTPDIFGRFYTRTLGVTSTGSSAIQINGATGNSAIIDFGVNGTRSAGITSNTTETTIGTLGSTPFRFETNALERMRITNGGNVGIGTTSPDTKLVVAGGTTASDTAQITIQGLNGAATELVFRSGDGSSNRRGALRFYNNFISSVTSQWVVGSSITQSGSNTDFHFVDNLNSYVLTLQQGGNIGIGTLTPTAKLDVAGNALFSGNVSLGTTYNAFPLNVQGTAYIIGGSVWVNDNYGLANATSVNTGLFPESTHVLRFKNNNTTTLTIDASGNVVITDLAGVGNRCVYADASGQLNVKNDDCGLASGGDDMGDHTATQNIILGSNWLSGDGGNEGIRVTSAGFVGVGTGTAAKILDVVGPDNGDAAIRLYKGLNNVANLSTGSSTPGDESAILQMYNNTGTEAIRMYTEGNSWITGGNVGIGTATPSRLLQVSGSAPTDLGVEVTNLNSGGYASVVLSPLGNTTYLAAAGSSVNWNGVGVGAAIFQSTGNIALATPLNNTRLLINSTTGNVLVGTIVDDTVNKLQVNGSIKGTNADFSGTAIFSGTGINNTPTSAGTAQTYLQFRNTGSDFYIGKESSTAGAFFTGSSAYANVFYTIGGSNAIEFIQGGTKTLSLANSGAAVFSNSVTASGVVSAANNNVTLVQGDVHFQSNAGYGILSANSNRAIAITNSAVGINYTLNGTTASFSGNVTTTGSTYASFIANGGSSTGGGGINFQRQGVSSGLIGVEGFVTGGNEANIAIFADASRSIKFMTGGSVVAKSTLTADGNFLIATTSDDGVNKLQVNGGIKGTVGKFGNAGANAALEVAVSSGEVFRADAASGAYRIIVDQTGVLLGGTIAVPTLIAGGGSVYPYLNPIITVSQSTNATVSNVVNNQFNGSGAYAKYIAAAYGNSWHFGMGSSTSTYGNDFTFTPDASASNTPVLRLSTAGAATFSSTVTGGSNISINANGTSFQWTNTGNNVAMNGTSGAWSLYTGTSSYDERFRVTAAGDYSFNLVSYSLSDFNPGYKTANFGGTGVLFRNQQDSYYISNTYYSAAATWRAKYSSADGQGYLSMIGGNLAWNSYDGAVDAGSSYGMTERFVITKAGRVGIGISTPDAPLHANGGTAMTSGWNRTQVLQATFPTLVFNSNATRWAGIGYDYSAPSYGMNFWLNSTSNDVTSGSSSWLLSLRNDGIVRMPSYGAGTLSTDASGNITASSDGRLKTVEGVFDRGLAEVLGIDTVLYRWNEMSGYDTEAVYAGFIAQNIQGVIPEAVGEDNRGYLTLNDRPILAATINAIKELDIKVQAIPSLTDQTLYEKIATFLQGIAEQGIAFVDGVKTKDIETENLCIKKSDGTPVCVNGDQLYLLLGNTSGSTSGGSENTPPEEPVEPSCSDGIQNQDETGVDNGGVCSPQDTQIQEENPPQEVPPSEELPPQE